jgi:hypothetical protein
MPAEAEEVSVALSLDLHIRPARVACVAEELAAEKVLATPLADAAREGFRITVCTDWNISESMIGSWPPGLLRLKLP